MKIVVTGANGYLGTGIVKQLCDDGNEVIAVCHHDSEEIDKRAKNVKCDIFSVENPFCEFGGPDCNTLQIAGNPYKIGLPGVFS